MTPVAIDGNLDPLTFPASQPVENCLIGPYEHAGSLYIVATVVPGTFQNQRLAAFKSSDAGLTWAVLAIETSFFIPNGAASVFYPGSGTVLYIGFMDDSGGNHGAFHDTTFDMSTETFGAIENLGISTPNFSGQLFLLRLSSGDFNFAWGEFSGGIRNVKFAAKISGVWSVATTVSGATPRSFMMGPSYEDANGAARLAWYETSVGGVPTAINDATISGLTVSNSVIPVTPTLFVDLNYSIQPTYVTATDEVAYPIISKASLADNEALYLRGENVSTSPAWSTVSVFSETATLDDFGQNQQIVPIPAGFAYFWTDLGTGSGNTDAYILKSTATTLDGPWSAPEIYYDADADPSVPPSHLNELYPMYARPLTDGSVGITIGEIQNVDSPSYCGVLYYLPPSVPAAEITLVATPGILFSVILTPYVPPPPPPPPPPEFCEVFTPTTPEPSLVSYDEPLELQGS